MSSSSKPELKAKKLTDTTYEYSDAAACAKSYKTLVASDRFSDITILAGSAKTRIAAHKGILATRCAVLAGMIAANPEAKELAIANYSASAVRTFLNCLYTGSVTLRSEDVDELVRLSAEYKFSDLRTSCETVMIDTLDPDTVFKSFQAAQKANLPLLQSACLDIIGRDTTKLFASADFLNDCSKDFLIRICKHDEMYASEDDLFDFCLRWARRQVAEKKLASSTENVAKELEDIIPHIRYGLFSAKFLLSEAKPTGLFSEDDILDALTFMANPSEAKEGDIRFRPRSKEITFKRYSSLPAKSSSWSFSSGNPDAIQIRPSRACYFSGIGVFIGTGSTKIKLELLEGTTKSLGVVETTLTATTKDNTVHGVRFKAPIPMKAGKNYVVKLIQKGNNACYCNSCPSTLKSPDATGLTLSVSSVSSISTNSTSNSRGQIPEIYVRM